MELLRAALDHCGRTAMVVSGRSYRYADLLTMALAASAQLAPSSPAGSSSGYGTRVALMCDPGVGYMAGTYATWLHHGIAVPLCISHPDRELQYVLEDAQVAAVLASERHAERLYGLAKPFGAEVHLVDDKQQGWPLGELPGALPPAEQQQQQEQQLRAQVQERLAGQGPGDGSLIVYTSGTTGRPKGVLHTHASLAAMVDTLCRAWEWQAQDRILHALPLHHVHGIVNALYCPLRVGACADMLPKFSPSEVWHRLERQQDPITVFMGVPTMYSHLLSRYDAMDAAQQAVAAAAARKIRFLSPSITGLQLRLTVSGSAACPAPIMQRWQELSGQTLLERYGMTETGMILGNPYRGQRRPETVGQAFPGVEVRITDKEGGNADAGPGEVHVKSPQLFKEYWGRPEATAAAFDEHGFFLTGDTASLEDGYYKMLGRSSVDIIKHGGYKISALAIESVLLEHPAIAEAAVLGLPDETYGERIAALVALKQPEGEASRRRTFGLTLGNLRAWAAGHLPAYQLPTDLKIVPAIPRNAMGKVNKKELQQQLFGGGAHGAATS